MSSAVSSSGNAAAAATALDRAITAFMRREQSSGLNPAQWAAIRYIAGSGTGEATTGGFARLRRTTPSSASQTVASLVRLGLVHRARRADGRSRALVLTARGRALLERDPRQQLVTALAGISTETLGEFTDVLNILMRALLA